MYVLASECVREGFAHLDRTVHGGACDRNRRRKEQKQVFASYSMTNKYGLEHEDAAFLCNEKDAGRTL
jgi:hypothetical protein